MATTEYSNLDSNGKVRQETGPTLFDVSTNTTDQLQFGPWDRDVVLKNAWVVCAGAWAVGTSVSFQFGTAASAGAFCTITPLLAQMAAVGDSVAVGTFTDNTVSAGQVVVIDSTKSGSMTGTARVRISYEYAV